MTTPEDLIGTVICLSPAARNFADGQFVYADGSVFTTIGKPAHER